MMSAPETVETSKTVMPSIPPQTSPAPAYPLPTAPVQPGPARIPSNLIADPQPAQDAAIMGETYRSQLLGECAKGNHQCSRAFGVCGIIAAILCFPCGLFCLYKDSALKCDRCHEIIQL